MNLIQKFFFKGKMMNIKNVIVVNKKTFYEFCFLERNAYSQRQRAIFSARDIARFKRMHVAHQKTLKEVTRVLDATRIHYRVSHRKMHIPYDRYDLVITVGGDGTFLQAARQLTQQMILGVNSDPQRSIGKFCAATEKDFQKVFSAILNGTVKTKYLERFLLKTKKEKKAFHVLNDVLICDENPAAMSRYVFAIGKKKEEQRSSGVWIATASGSTGAIHSSGGIILKDTSKKIQYRPRELYYGKLNPYCFNGATLFLKKPIKIRSMMRNGVIYIDGAHFKIPFLYGDEATVECSSIPIRTFTFKL